MLEISPSPRPNSSSQSSSTNYVNNISSNAINRCTTKTYLFLIIILLIFTIFFQWRGSSTELLTRLSLESPTICATGSSTQLNLSSSDHNESTNKIAKNEKAQMKSFDFSNIGGWNFNYNESFVRPKICITATTSAGVEDIVPWIFYHKVVGITNFFLFVEGKAANPTASKLLQSIPGVKTIPRTRELEVQQANSRIWNETWLSNEFHKPCNHALFVKQNLNMEMAIVMAKEAGMEWIIHLDTDELLHPGGTQDYSVLELLARVPSEVDALVFLNYESAVERDDIKHPFDEVSMFKRNIVHLPMNNSDLKFYLYKEATRPGNPSYFLTYSNGKSAARIQDHLRPNGAHRWSNYNKDLIELEISEAVVLHYTYARFSDLTSRRDRCNCKPTQEDVKRCFYLKFDSSAFIIASTAPRPEMLQWYQEHVVWGDEELKLKLLKYGILTRIYTPMVIIKQLKASQVYASMINSIQDNSSSHESQGSLNGPSLGMGISSPQN